MCLRDLFPTRYRISSEKSKDRNIEVKRVERVHRDEDSVDSVISGTVKKEIEYLSELDQARNEKQAHRRRIHKHSNRKTKRGKEKRRRDDRRNARRKRTKARRK